ncbi:hypothetical protein ACQR1W_17810 [Bradyrhizobium sp. HKCCYLS1011]|uniref:hypothetical protein n=1 Tax=Bradyrhizobium sp. HKCCYLS1011 TaxID=3420733 RepID=UPI003EB75948
MHALAEVLSNGDETTLGRTDSDLCAEALRFYATATQPGADLECDDCGAKFGSAEATKYRSPGLFADILHCPHCDCGDLSLIAQGADNSIGKPTGRRQ